MVLQHSCAVAVESKVETYEITNGNQQTKGPMEEQSGSRQKR